MRQLNHRDSSFLPIRRRLSNPSSFGEGSKLGLTLLVNEDDNLPNLDLDLNFFFPGDWLRQRINLSSRVSTRKSIIRAVPVGPSYAVPRILMMLGWIRLDRSSFSNVKSLWNHSKNIMSAMLGTIRMKFVSLTVQNEYKSAVHHPFRDVQA